MKRPTVFLSHSHKDAAFASDLRARLAEDGIDTWLDAVEIKIGETIHQKVNDGLSQSDFFAIILSAASVSSRWVQEELSSASNLEKYSKKGVFLLPILLEECDVPPLLLDRRYANFARDSESAYQELIDAIESHYRRQDSVETESGLGIDGVARDFIEAAADDPSRFTELAPRVFEELVAALLEKFGYEVHLTGLSNDGGFDIVAIRSTLPSFAPERMLVVCKRYKGAIGAALVREFMGTLFLSNEAHGAFVTTSYFTTGAIDVANQARNHGLSIELVDGKALAGWVSRYLSQDDV